MNHTTYRGDSNIVTLPSANTDAAKWRRFFQITNTPTEPNGGALWLPLSHTLFLPDAEDLFRLGMGYPYEIISRISIEMDCPVIVPGEFPKFYDVYDFDYENLSRYGMLMCCDFIVSENFDGCMGLAWANTSENVFARDDDRPNSPVYACAYAHISMKQERQDDSRYRPCIPYDAYLKAADPSHPKLPPAYVASVPENSDDCPF